MTKLFKTFLFLPWSFKLSCYNLENLIPPPPPPAYNQDYMECFHAIHVCSCLLQEKEAKAKDDDDDFDLFGSDDEDEEEEEVTKSN